MTGDQYDALVKLMRGIPTSPANRAARRVLVDGITQADAMRETGVTRATVNQAVTRYADADTLMRGVYAGGEK
ncbi:MULTISPECIES: transcriptional regulator KorA [Pseudomonas syringae group]|nr:MULTISPECIES: transcriptional regulator KorA [Pseudomonas syringae group]MEE4573152.1 transcriptional regulator KorA [Pseudomonas alliivorans]MCQ9390984.1 transcriptional regulator KorA [Pseudomonas viridiflava]MEE4178940.1 transcriptional regulator KorA [Pseudomonas viridiflava]MEE5081264.1 transcriptional regulator KorA [Pseudomonas alliivorans]MEE5167925.1 transcriptional regulator KorA [Pseudomonas alliivorans]